MAGRGISRNPLDQLSRVMGKFNQGVTTFRNVANTLKSAYEYVVGFFLC